MSEDMLTLDLRQAMGRMSKLLYGVTNKGLNEKSSLELLEWFWGDIFPKLKTTAYDPQVAVVEVLHREWQQSIERAAQLEVKVRGLEEKLKEWADGAYFVAGSGVTTENMGSRGGVMTTGEMEAVNQAAIKLRKEALSLAVEMSPETIAPESHSKTIDRAKEFEKYLKRGR